MSKGTVMSPTTSTFGGNTWGTRQPLASDELKYKHGSSSRRGNIEPIFTSREGIDAKVVWVTPEAHNRMVGYVGHCNYEIGWYGTVEVLSGGQLLIDNVYLFPQEVSGATTETSNQNQDQFIHQILADYDHEQAADIINRIRMWGHSHVNMGVTPSVVDDNQMLKFDNSIGASDTPFMIRLIMNKKGDVRYDVYDYSLNVAHMNVPWMLYTDELNNPEEDIVDEINRLVTLKKYVTRTPGKAPGKSGVGTVSTVGAHSGVMDMRGFDNTDWTDEDHEEFDRLFGQSFDDDELTDQQWLDQLEVGHQ